jgi:hypothetical protein
MESEKRRRGRGTKRSAIRPSRYRREPVSQADSPPGAVRVAVEKEKDCRQVYFLRARQ